MNCKNYRKLSFISFSLFAFLLNFIFSESITIATVYTDYVSPVLDFVTYLSDLRYTHVILPVYNKLKLFFNFIRDLSTSAFRTIALSFATVGYSILYIGLKVKDGVMYLKNKIYPPIKLARFINTRIQTLSRVYNWLIYNITAVGSAIIRFDTKVIKTMCIITNFVVVNLNWITSFLVINVFTTFNFIAPSFRLITSTFFNKVKFLSFEVLRFIGKIGYSLNKVTFILEYNIFKVLKSQYTRAKTGANFMTAKIIKYPFQALVIGIVVAILFIISLWYNGIFTNRVKTKSTLKFLELSDVTLKSILKKPNKLFLSSTITLISILALNLISNTFVKPVFEYAKDYVLVVPETLIIKPSQNLKYGFSILGFKYNTLLNILNLKVQYSRAFEVAYVITLLNVFQLIKLTKFKLRLIDCHLIMLVSLHLIDFLSQILH